MDHWTLAIEKNTAALTQIVAGLFLLVGGCLNSASPSGSRPSLDELRSSADQRFTDGAALSRKAGLATEGECPNQDEKFTIQLTSIKRRILMRVLRTAEAALRRLIVLYVNVHGLKAKAPKPNSKPLPDFTSFGSGSNKRKPVFRLFDPRKRLVMLDGISSFSAKPSGLPYPLDGAALSRKAGLATEGECHENIDYSSLADEPRIWIMGNSDWNAFPSACSICHGKRETGFDQSLRGSRSKCDQHLCHCVSVRSLDSEQEINSAETHSSQKLLTRLAALNHALKTIPHQARRLARIMAKREKAPPGIKCIPPIRPGIPPGYARHSKAPEQQALRECHGLMRDWESGFS